MMTPLNCFPRTFLRKISPEDRHIFSIKRYQVHTIVKKYGKMIGVDIHPNTFRHSFAIQLVRPGLDLWRVQQLLGHSNLDTTQVYLQFNDQNLRKGYNKIEF